MKIRINIYLLLLFNSCCYSCSADSLSRRVSTWFTVSLIRCYQDYSKEVPFEMCIFEPSCSNFTIQAIRRYGVLKGIPISANRLIRCNPSRIFEKSSDYIYIGNKLFDPPEDYGQNLNNFSYLYLIPGIYQIKNRKYFDGVLSFGFTAIPIYGLINHKFDLSVSSIIFIFLEVIFYSGHLNYCYTFNN